jgi:hypothetical protein
MELNDIIFYLIFDQNIKKLKTISQNDLKCDFESKPMI